MAFIVERAGIDACYAVFGAVEHFPKRGMAADDGFLRFQWFPGRIRIRVRISLPDYGRTDVFAVPDNVTDNRCVSTFQFFCFIGLPEGYALYLFQKFLFGGDACGRSCMKDQLVSDSPEQGERAVSFPDS